MRAVKMARRVKVLAAKSSGLSLIPALTGQKDRIDCYKLIPEVNAHVPHIPGTSFSEFCESIITL